MDGFLDYPLYLDGRGRTATTDENEHIRDMIMQVLFTDPGERVNRPDFGCGLKQLVFRPNSDVLAAATQTLVKGSLQRWLQNEIQVEAVGVHAEDSRLEVTVAYSVRVSGERRVDVFSRGA
jgi:phage baseplate assembly protein W